jgi:hypothetical protein
MATKTTTAAATPSTNVMSKAERLQFILGLQNAPATAKTPGESRVFQVVGDVLADARKNFGAIAAGWKAGKANYHIERESEVLRQAERTDGRLQRLLATRERLGLD